jgi:hypothetical protein
MHRPDVVEILGTGWQLEQLIGLGGGMHVQQRIERERHYVD